MLLWLFFDALRRSPDNHNPIEYTYVIAIISVLPIALTTVVLFFARKEGAIFITCCVILLVTGYSMYKTSEESYLAALVLRSLFSWGAFFVGSVVALVAILNSDKKR